MHCFVLILIASGVFSAPLHLTSRSNATQNIATSEWPPMPFYEILSNPYNPHFKISFINAFGPLPDLTKDAEDLLERTLDIVSDFPPSRSGPDELDLADPNEPVWLGCKAHPGTTEAKIAWTYETVENFLITLKDLISKHGFQELFFDLVFQDVPLIESTVAACSMLQQRPPAAGNHNGTLVQSVDGFRHQDNGTFF